VGQNNTNKTSKLTRAVSLIVTAGVALGALSTTSIAGTPSDHSPPDQMLVVTTNVQEAWGGTTNDMRNMSELDNYVRRLLNQVPFHPDVVLLQEVRRKSAKYIKNLLTDATGDAYGWGWTPPRRPWTQNPQRRWEMDSGILINTETTRKLDQGGWIDLTYKRSQASDRSIRVETTRHARVSVAERDGDMSLGAASVHLQYGRMMARYEDRYQVAWTDKIASTLMNRYPSTTRTFGGDFNQDRCEGQSDVRNCRRAPFWANVTTDPWNYDDMLYRAFLDGDNGVGLGGVDFIFTRGTTVSAGSDTSYDKNDPQQFYSDHRFFWGVVSD
jgi:hypothetical protein